MIVLLWLACAGDAAQPPDDGPVDTDVVDTAADPCRRLTWASAGGPFTRTWCATCHSAELTGAARAGAPVGLDLDTEAQVVAHAARVRARALVDPPTMPPVVVPPAGERAAFDAWLRCVAP